MNRNVLAAEISVAGINVGMVDRETHFVIPGSCLFEAVDTHDTARNIISGWATTIRKCANLNNASVSKVGIAMTGPCDYEQGVSLMKNQNKFDALYGLNVKDLLAAELGISSNNILMKNNSACFLQGEVYSGCAQGGFSRILGYTLNIGFGTAWYLDGEVEDMKLWNVPFKDSIAEDYLGVGWITRRYEEFKGIKVDNIQDVACMAKQDDGIGQLVFNEYGENFVKFLIQQINIHKPQLIVIGGKNHAWDLFIPHVKDRLSDKNISVPIRQAILGSDATLIGAANLLA
jgi:glucokinase